VGPVLGEVENITWVLYKI